MDDKQQVLVYVKDLEKMAALIDDLAWEVDRVSGWGMLTYNDLALTLEELMIEHPECCITDSSKKSEVFWTDKRKVEITKKRKGNY